MWFELTKVGRVSELKEKKIERKELRERLKGIQDIEGFLQDLPWHSIPGI